MILSAFYIADIRCKILRGCFILIADLGNDLRYTMFIDVEIRTRLKLWAHKRKFSFPRRPLWELNGHDWFIIEDAFDISLDDEEISVVAGRISETIGE